MLYYKFQKVSYKIITWCLLLPAVLLFSFRLNAQIEKGRLLAGGNLTFQSEKYSLDDDRMTTFVLMPMGGYFIMDKLAGGARISLAYAKDENDDYREFLGGPFVRYYFLPVGKKTNLFAEANFMAGFEKYSGHDSEGKTQYGIMAGPAFFIGQQVALECALGWRRWKNQQESGHSNSFGLNVGFQIHLHSGKPKQGK